MVLQLLPSFYSSSSRGLFFVVSTRTQGCSNANCCSSHPIDWRRLVDGRERWQSGSLSLKFRQRNLCSSKRLATSFVFTQLEIKLAKNWFILLLQSWVTLHFSFFTEGKHNEGKVRPKLADAVFNREVHILLLIVYFWSYIFRSELTYNLLWVLFSLVKNSQKASVRRREKNGESLRRYYTPFENCFLPCLFYLENDMWQVVHVFISFFLCTSLALDTMTHVTGKSLRLKVYNSWASLTVILTFSQILHPRCISTYSWRISSLKKNKKSKGSAFMSLMLPAGVSLQWPSVARSCLTTRAKPRTSWIWRKETLSSSWKR